jgi:hypothetical protein
MGFLPRGPAPPFTDAKRRADTARATFCLNPAEPIPLNPIQLNPIQLNPRDQLAARRLILLSASVVSFLSVAFSSSRVFCRTLAQSLRPSCLAHAIRLP